MFKLIDKIWKCSETTHNRWLNMVKECKHCNELRELLNIAREHNQQLLKEKHEWKSRVYQVIANAIDKMV